MERPSLLFVFIYNVIKFITASQILFEQTPVINIVQIINSNKKKSKFSRLTTPSLSRFWHRENSINKLAPSKIVMLLEKRLNKHKNPVQIYYDTFQ